MASETHNEKAELLELDDILKKIDVLPEQPNALATSSNPDDTTSQPKKKWWQSKGTKPATDGKPDPAQSTLIPFSALFRFADGLDIFLMVLGSVGAICLGVSLPFMTVIFANVIDSLSQFTIALSLNQDLQPARDRLNHDVLLNTFYFIALAAVSFIVSYLMLSCWMIAGERQTKRIRERFFTAILRQEMGWFDSNATGDLTTRISGDTSILQEGISDKVGLVIQNMCTFLSGFVIAFVKGWKLALVLLSVMPLLVAVGVIMAKFVSSSSSDGQDAYGEAGAIASQVFGSIRTVVAFGGEQKEINRYVAKLDVALRVNTKKALISAAGLGAVMGTIFATYALAFWYGGTQVMSGQMTGGQVLNVFFSLIIGAFSLGNIAPPLTNIANARGAATKLYHVIDRVPVIPVTESNPSVDTDVVTNGEIVLSDISFKYPSRPDTQVLNNFSLHVKAGQTIALVGSSGSGKSTIVSLLERFYEPSSGVIILDGQPLQSVPPHILRKKVSLVSQEPILFSTSIYKNIALGIHTEEEKTLTEEEIHRRVESAARLSNAHDFIMDLPDKYDTLVGSRGSQMSGGQKQRIAIARAMISNPSILLLDEATSALDTESERLVQSALEVASEGRTTIVIAHRLSTIKDADCIVVMDKGNIVEQGTHEQLIALHGMYYGLVRAQEVNTQRRSGEVTEKVLTTPVEGEEDAEDVETASTSSNVTPERTVVTIKRSAAELEEQKKMKEAKQKEEESRLNKLPMPLMRVLRLNLAEWPLLIIGCLAAAVTGATQPIFAVIFSQILAVFTQAGGAFLANFLQGACFSISGERLTKRVRFMTFKTLIRQEIAFFDDERHTAGALTTRLAVDASKIEGITGATMGTLVQTIVTLAIGIILGFVNGWKLSLVILACLPLLVAAGILEMQALAGYGGKTRKAYEESGQIANEAIENIRTIASLTREETFRQMYFENIIKPHRIAIHGYLVAAIGFGAAQAIMYLAYALAFWYGSQLVATLEYTQKQMMISMFTLVFSAMAAGQFSTFAPNIAKAKVAAYNVFEILDRSSSIDPMAEGGDRPAPVTGETDIKNGEFTYPARPNIQILKGLDLSVHRDQTVAIVGPSGSGKSTVVQLVQRFYDLDRGEITVNRVRLPDWNIAYLRSQFSLVGQEPVLFDLTIGENIAYGFDGVSQEQIEEAAKAANIHHFISELPEGYQTRVGERGTQLSGGQRQRLAIARAIIRRPKLLLLDEATSALDSESEKVVQRALDKAAIGRTTITIAHRLSTIQNADWIVVLKKGIVVEQGKHMDLIEQKGIYYKLVHKQILTGPAH